MAFFALKKYQFFTEKLLLAGMALRKSRVRDFGGLVVRRFAYAKPVCVRDSRWREKSRRVRKSRTQNRVAYANRVRKSRTQIAPSVRKSHSVKSQQKSRTQIENRVRKSRPARLDFAYATRFAYAILRTRFLKNPPKSATENRVRKSDWRTRFAYANAIRAA